MSNRDFVESRFCRQCRVELLPNKMCGNPHCVLSQFHNGSAAYAAPTAQVLPPRSQQQNPTTPSFYNPPPITPFSPPNPRRGRARWFVIGAVLVVALVMAAGIGAYQIGISQTHRSQQSLATAPASLQLSPTLVRATPTLDAQQAIQSADFSNFIQAFAILMAHKDYTTIQKATDTANFQEVHLFADGGLGSWKDMHNQLTTGNINFVIQSPPITAAAEGYGVREGNVCTMYGKNGLSPFINIKAAHVQAIVGTSIVPNSPSNSLQTAPNRTVFIFELPNGTAGTSWLWRAVTFNNQACAQQ